MVKALVGNLMFLFWLAGAGRADAQFSYSPNGDGATCTLTGYTGTDGVIAIPAQINGLTVVSIGYAAFAGPPAGLGVLPEFLPNPIPTIVTIPDTVTNIAGSAFFNCDNLTNVTLGSGLTSIGGEAFGYCGLTSVTIPSGVVDLAVDAFVDCPRLAAIAVAPGNLNYNSTNGVLYDQPLATALFCPPAFAGSLVLPGSVTNIASTAFYGCAGLTSVTMGGNVASIGHDAFSECLGLTNMVLSAGLVSLGELAFADCSRLARVTLPGGLTTLGEAVFDACSSLRQVVIQEGVTDIPVNTFAGCTSLTNVTLPDTVTEIDNWAFGFCSALTAVYFAGNAPPASQFVFYEAPAQVYYLPGTTGWGATFDGVPASPWFRPAPTILGQGSGLGVGTNGFGFAISWATNGPVVVEASTNLVRGGWWPVATNVLSGGATWFEDAQWQNYPGRFYRVRSR